MQHNGKDFPKSSPPSLSSNETTETEYDVIIVGAGVAGCSAAYHLSLLTQQQAKEAATSLRILVVDAGPAAGEGLAPHTRSGTATMEVAPCVKMMVQLFAGSCDEFMRHHGHQGAKQYLDATREGLVIQKGIAGQLWGTTTTDDEESCSNKHLKKLGSYYVGSTEQDEIELRREYDILSSLMDGNDSIEWCDVNRLSSVEGMSTDFCCGIYFPNDAVIDSSLYAKMLVEHVVKNSEGNAEFWSDTTVQSIDSQAGGGEKVTIKRHDEENQHTITAKHVVIATGALRISQHQEEILNGLIKPCYSYLVHVPTTKSSRVAAHNSNSSNSSNSNDDDDDDDDDDGYCSPNFFTWGYTHDWCYTNGKIRVSGEDHFSAYKSPEVEERCNRLSRWTLERYGCNNSYTDQEVSSFPKQYGLYSETVDMVPIVGTLLMDQQQRKEEKRNGICYLLGCNAWGQTILSYCASLVPGLLGYQDFTDTQRDILQLVSIRRFSRLPSD